LDVIHLWDAPAVVREYLETGDESKRDAAWAAARDAAWGAALAAVVWDLASPEGTFTLEHRDLLIAPYKAVFGLPPALRTANGIEADFDEVADFIEALIAERDALRAELVDANRTLTSAEYEFADLRAEVERLTSELSVRGES